LFYLAERRFNLSMAICGENKCSVKEPAHDRSALARVYQGRRAARRLQIEKRLIPTTEKIRLVDALSDTGLDYIQVTSFVHPGKVPGMADAEAVVAGMTPREGCAMPGCG
jgi:hypothetical protein